MYKQISFPLLVVKQIANMMAIQNPLAPNYLKGPELVNLFNALGYPEPILLRRGEAF